MTPRVRGASAAQHHNPPRDLVTPTVIVTGGPIPEVKDLAFYYSRRAAPQPQTFDRARRGCVCEFEARSAARPPLKFEWFEPHVEPITKQCGLQPITRLNLTGRAYHAMRRKAAELNQIGIGLVRNDELAAELFF